MVTAAENPDAGAEATLSRQRTATVTVEAIDSPADGRFDQWRSAFGHAGASGGARTEGVLVDAQPADARVERAGRHAERRRGSVGAAHAAARLTERVLDALPGILRLGARVPIDREVRQLEQGRLQHLVPREDHGPLHDVLQLAHVARPRVGFERGQRHRAQARDALADRARVVPGVVPASSRTSPARSRSGGTAIGTTLSR